MCSNVSSYDHSRLAAHVLPNLSSVSAADGMSRKRAHDSSEQGPGSAKRVARTTIETVFRLLIPSTRIGRLIGKQGAQIKQLREETAARIKITDPISNVEERVVVITSKEESTNSRTAAEDALLRLATVVLEDQADGTATASIGPQHHVAANLTRLLIAGSQAGCLIGKAGATIKEIRDTSGASVRVMPPEQLPVCSGVVESDRLVQLSGEVPQVQHALEIIAAKLRVNPPRDSTVARPAYYFGVGPQQQQLLIPIYTVQSSQPSVQSPAAPTVAYGMMRPPTAPTKGNLKITTEMTVPSTQIGGVIGRGGSNINQIRALSGASIKVSSQKDGNPGRSITIEGTPEQVHAAKSLVQAYMHAS